MSVEQLPLSQPDAQSQWYDPGVFTHVLVISHGELAHSSMSVQFGSRYPFLHLQPSPRPTLIHSSEGLHIELKNVKSRRQDTYNVCYLKN
jgi:hypothetical protein